MLLKIACMDQGLQPQMGNYKKLDFRKVHGRLKTYIAGLIWTLGFLEAEEIWDSRWVPSKVPFRVLPLLLSLYTQCKRTNKDKAEKLIRGYCWRTFLTERYTRQVNDRLYDDFLELRSRLEKKSLALESTKDTIFDAHRYKVPRVDDIKDETWPTKKSNLSKAMLAIFVKKGAKGIETGKRLTHSTIQSRDYHHIFPIKLLGDKEAASHAINCMLLEPEANRSWNKKWPGEYLTRLEVNRSDLIDRLSSHTLPEAFLIDAKKEKEKRELKKQYEEFCNLRAALVIAAMNKLYKGEEYR